MTEVSVSGVRLVGGPCRVTRLPEPPPSVLAAALPPPSYIVPGASFLVGVRGLPVLADANVRPACPGCVSPPNDAETILQC